MSSVSACLITRDEEVHLPGCLAFLSGHVDEVVLVDTGSVDRTVAIAEEYGCRVLHHPWQEDFATPRNLGLEQAGGDWILYIDADERLSCDSGRSLRALLPGPNFVAARVKFFPRSDTTPYAEYRLFRNDSRIRFVGSMHETVLASMRRLCAEEGLAIEDRFSVTITHLGYEGDQSGKHTRNLPLLECAIREDPNRVYLRYHLGATLSAIGRPTEAAVQLTKGLELAARKGASTQARVEGSVCAHVLVDLRLTEGDLAGALKTAEEGLLLYPDNLALQWTRARLLMTLDRASEAIAVLEGHLNHDGEIFFDPALAYSKRLFGEDRFGLLGSAWFKQDAYAKAAACFEEAAEHADDPLEFRSKAALARARSRRVEQPASYRTQISCSNFLK